MSNDKKQGQKKIPPRDAKTVAREARDRAYKQVALGHQKKTDKKSK